jgi:hypothetical protein
MNMAVESMEMAMGAIPHPDRVTEQRFLSLETCLRCRRRCRTFRGWRLPPLGFSRRGQYIGERARSVDAWGAHTIARRGRGARLGMVWLAPGSPPGLLWTPCTWQKIGTSGIVSSNSENISRTTFLKYKNSRKQELALWYLVNRLVPENA